MGHASLLRAYKYLMHVCKQEVSPGLDHSHEILQFIHLSSGITQPYIHLLVALFLCLSQCVTMGKDSNHVIVAHSQGVKDFDDSLCLHRPSALRIEDEEERINLLTSFV